VTIGADGTITINDTSPSQSLRRRASGQKTALFALALVGISCVPADNVDGKPGDAATAPATETANPLCDRYRTDGDVTPSYAVIQQIFDDNCTSCHAGEAALDLSAGHSWANIVGQASPSLESCGGILVAPGDPDGSYLYQKLTNDHPCAGSRMPRGDIQAYPLPACVTDLVRSWIAGGAAGPDGGAVDSNADTDEAGAS
jgi:hypothetical protein